MILSKTASRASPEPLQGPLVESVLESKIPTTYFCSFSGRPDDPVVGMLDTISFQYTRTKSASVLYRTGAHCDTRI